jgi:predicted alpha/beta-fold hydrolase
MREKSTRFPTVFNIEGLSRITTFHEFDRRFTAPFHGFKSVQEYWSASSSLRFLPTISIPTLALSALDDPFLSPSCYPYQIARTHPWIHLETPQHGGHVGFWDTPHLGNTWGEVRAIEFLESVS